MCFRHALVAFAQAGSRLKCVSTQSTLLTQSMQSTQMSDSTCRKTSTGVRQLVRRELVHNIWPAIAVSSDINSIASQIGDLPVHFSCPVLEEFCCVRARSGSTCEMPLFVVPHASKWAVCMPSLGGVLLCESPTRRDVRVASPRSANRFQVGRLYAQCQRSFVL